MSDNNAGWIGPSQTLRTAAEPLLSPQYGPAWVADCLGTTHEQRVDALVEAGWTINPNLADHTAVTYARLRAESTDRKARILAAAREAVEDEHSHGGTPTLEDGCAS
jgi:hypothetical protein